MQPVWTEPPAIKRMPAHMLRELDRLKGIAIAMVLVSQWDCAQALLPEVARSSWSGIDLLFVVSGYLTTRSLLRVLPSEGSDAGLAQRLTDAREPLGGFFLHRFLRVVPLVALFFLVNRVVMRWFPQNFGSPEQWWREVVAFFGGIYGYDLAFHTDFRMAILWPIAVGAHFTLALGLIFAIFRKPGRRLGACLCVVLLVMAGRALPVPNGADAGTYALAASHLRLDAPMAGAIVALVGGELRRAAPALGPIVPPWVMRYAVLPAVVVVIACLPGAVPQQVAREEGLVALWFLSALLVAFASLDRGYVLPIPVLAPVLQYLGSRSLPLYLAMVPVGRLEDDLGGRWPRYRALVPEDAHHPLVRTLVLLATTILVAEVVHRCVEQPFRRIARARSPVG